jgi:ADP-ribosylglycohydrolase
MSAGTARYEEQIYAGVLGKIIGVYLGRPVEGWHYEDIERRFGEVRHYVHDAVGAPLIVADDDISGTFGFFRVMADNGHPAEVDPAAVGDTWLNHIIERKTILWWGGLGRSTEHTAFLRLKDGVRAPQSGSIALNGRTLAEQIGAQIFMDAFAMMHPGDPERAAAAVRAAASVSHDGIALEAAAFLGAMEALAFDEPSLPRLLERGRGVVRSSFVDTMVDDVLGLCDGERDWRAVRAAIDDRYGPDRYPGPCHIVTNHAMVLAALLLGGDDFQRSVMIAASAGFDTDCNAGNVGCLNAIRLGLDAIDAQVDFRGPVADRLLVVTADGGSCVSDAVIEARKIADAARAQRGEPLPGRAPRFCFEHRGSVQGFGPCPYLPAPYDAVSVGNAGSALEIRCRAIGPGVAAAVSTPVFLEPASGRDNFSTVASPSLYPGQLVTAHVSASEPGAAVRPYVVTHDQAGQPTAVRGELADVASTPASLSWRIPDTGPNPLVRVGVEVVAERRYDGTVRLELLDWDGAPEGFEQRGTLMASIWDTAPRPLSAWVSSAENFEADFRYSYAIAHSDGPGLATIGTPDWDDYRVSSTLIFGLHRSAGLVARSVGHRRYYAACFADGRRVALLRRTDGETRALAEVNWAYEHDVPYEVALECVGAALRLTIDGEDVLAARDDDPRPGGGAGFLVEGGTLFADGIRIGRAPGRSS